MAIAGKVTLDDAFGKAVSMKDAQIMTPDMLPMGDPESEGAVYSNDPSLWEYHELNRINGIPVAEEDQKAPIDKPDVLSMAFVEDVKPRSAVLWISPDDTEALKKYQEIWDMVYDHRARIISEDKQYDQTKNKFMVWIRYEEVVCRLHPRFQFLKEKKENG